jgi:putative spermidine/putrescine transport system substrate-binding protein
MLARLAVAALLVLGLPVASAHAQSSLVISVWGGNWKDTVERVIGKAFTAKTGTPVEFEVGGTIDRLAKARVAKGSPLVDLTFTTSHVGRLYISDGLFAPLDMAKLPNAKEAAREALRSEYQMGGWSYVYTIVYRPDLVKEEITKWSDLWKPSLRGVQTELTVEIGGGQRLLVFAAEPAPAALAAGQAVRLHLAPDAFMRLGPAGEEAGG